MAGGEKSKDRQGGGWGKCNGPAAVSDGYFTHATAAGPLFNILGRYQTAR